MGFSGRTIFESDENGSKNKTIRDFQVWVAGPSVKAEHKQVGRKSGKKYAVLPGGGDILTFPTLSQLTVSPFKE